MQAAGYALPVALLLMIMVSHTVEDGKNGPGHGQQQGEEATSIPTHQPRTPASRPLTLPTERTRLSGKLRLPHAALAALDTGTGAIGAMTATVKKAVLERSRALGPDAITSLLGTTMVAPVTLTSTKPVQADPPTGAAGLAVCSTWLHWPMTQAGHASVEDGMRDMMQDSGAWVPREGRDMIPGCEPIAVLHMRGR